MVEHIVLKEKTKKRLFELKKQMKTRSIDVVVTEILKIHDNLGYDPRQIAINEIDEIINKYDRLFTPDEKTFMLNVPAYLRSSNHTRRIMLRELINNLTDEPQNQTKLK